MNIEEISIEKLKPYENNPRNNKTAIEYVKNSIKEFGFKVPIVIGNDDIIVCGHTRYLAAKELDMKTVPCVRADDLTDDQIKAFRIADNKTAELAGWKTKLLDDELKELCDFNMELFGFPQFELKGQESNNTNADKTVESAKMVRCPHCGKMLEAKKVKIKYD